MCLLVSLQRPVNHARSGEDHYRQVMGCIAGLAPCQEEGNCAKGTELRSPILGHHCHLDPAEPLVSTSHHQLLLDSGHTGT